MRPAALVLLPMWMTPLRKVPVVMTTLLHVMCSPVPQQQLVPDTYPAAIVAAAETAMKGRRLHADSICWTAAEQSAHLTFGSCMPVLQNRSYQQ